MSTSVDTFIAILVEGDHVEEVKEALEDYKLYLETEAFQYPMNMAKVKASEVVVQGNLVFFIQFRYSTSKHSQIGSTTELCEKQWTFITFKFFTHPFTVI